ncbi:SET domain-containing protein [Alloalcanivorax mobilis]|uniref:SET domain-containing protein n=1 Tax=Alloalcanivorax mobilis TaxID=2019569 RepID=UPI000B5B4949|nr:SET domain-containing protein [Alloalcanivorax mobilis]ASK33925.1 SET domain-containing protein-lysine N-methyltransferase [Alcanivorax sp. N3-2A]|tara:strand:- start:43016 stop:43339 length:324 start_codon:yes stop_codon:yes gene_type:complete
MSKPFLRDDLVEVRNSPIHGRGLFARADIPRETLLGRVKTQPAKGNGPYVLWIDDQGEERYRVLCDLRFINHGKKPNVAYYDDLTVVALKRIKAGQELLHDYGEEWA